MEDEIAGITQMEKMPVGRPTDFTPELADAICSRVAQGESMRSISRDESMPGMTTLFMWLREHGTFLKQYTIAKEECAELYADDIINIADNEVGNPLVVDNIPVVIDGKPVMVVDGPAVNHARLRVDSRKWVASRLLPKKYGDKQSIEHSGSVQYSNMTEEQIDARIRALESQQEPED